MKHNFTALKGMMQYPHPNRVLELLGLTPDSHNRQFDAKVLHGGFNEKVLSKIMKNDTVYVTTVREPFEQFKSFYLYRYHMQKPIAVLQREIEDMILTSQPSPEKNYFRSFQNTQYKKLENTMFRYFCYDYNTSLFNKTYAKGIISHINSIFSVIVVDKYDESLLLLKRQLCWDIKNIIFITHKNASYSKKGEKSPKEATLREYHRNISELDYDLYHYFSQIHDEQVKKHGEDFRDELKEYQRVKAVASTFCWNIYSQLMKVINVNSLQFTTILAEEITIEGSRFWNSFALNAKDCVLMAICAWDYKDISAASSYPILCRRKLDQVTFDRKFCASKYKNMTKVFAYDNVYFPYTDMKRIIGCDLIRSFG